MLVFAHRGYHADATENTLQAFVAAVELGVAGIETDVRLSRDGVPVVIHDRVTPGGHAVADLTHAELARELGHPVPALAEILEALPAIHWNIEVKCPEALPAAVSVLRRFQHCTILLTSFRHDVVVEAAGALDVECGLLLAHRPLDAGPMLAACSHLPRIRTVVWDYNIVDDGALQAVRERGWSNYAYGPVTAAEHAHCATLGLAGLITDYPLPARSAP